MLIPLIIYYHFSAARANPGRCDGGSRYPKRNLPKTDYSRIESPEEDDFICKYNAQSFCIVGHVNVMNAQQEQIYFDFIR